MGCETKVQRRQVEFHVQSAMKLHLDLACVKLNDTEVKLNTTQAKLNDTQETTTRLMEKLDNLQRRFEERNINEEIVMARNESLEFPRAFLWKVDNFIENLRQATAGRHRLASTPFYTERYGYKLRLSIVPNGDGRGKNTHLSVFIIVMKGEYDTILTWPFKKEVKFTLIDQQEDPVERQNVIRKLTGNSLKSNYDRPIGGENKGRGFPEFITHEKLHSRRYILDDTLFLQVEVGP
ncbi:TNF receptor-associated factor 1-like isoform X1 [Orbicella faveolata]|uniref:TNF receptor-associated factor 1-like isoform X1 n=2 Tax=Orbicella faveolata TaxID=48498 RepID=UPI0009E27445|nr:TNF receptor-associated factor 1-like isoform X1 [Orbicella faveolata]